MKRIATLLGLCVLLIANASYATTIFYDVTSLGGNTWEYNYTIENTEATDIEEFSIWFDVGLFENLAVTGSPTDWDPLVFDPEPSIPDDGLVDWLALGAGIASGGSLGGFSVMFDFLGTGTPGGQLFDIVDPFSFDVIFSGTTEERPAVQVPEPSTIALFGLGLIGLLAARRRQRAAVLDRH